MDPEKQVLQDAALTSEHPHAPTNQDPLATPLVPHVVSDTSSLSDNGVDIEKDLSRDPEKLQVHDVQRTLTTSTSLSILTTNNDEPKSELHKNKPWYKKLNPLKWGGKPPVPKEREVSHEYTAGFFSQLVFQWMSPLMTTGYKRPLEINDIWLVNPDRKMDLLVAKFSESFDRRVARGDKHPVLFALHETFKIEFWIGGICQLFANIFQVISPFLLRYLIQFANDAYDAQFGKGTNPPIGRGLGLVFGITVMQILQSLGTSHFLYRGFMVGGESRGVLITVIFEKALKLSARAKAGGKPEDPSPEDEAEQKAKQEKLKKSMMEKLLTSKPKPGAKAKPDDSSEGWSNGRIISLMATDTYRVDQASGMFHMIWTSPIAILITLVVLLINLTYSALAGFGLLVLGFPVLSRAVKMLFHRRRAINKITDQRITLTQEILQSIRFVKFFGWESSFLERINVHRRKEIRAIQLLLTIRNAILSVSLSLPLFASMLSFICYSLSNHDLTPGPIFSSLALFNALRMPLNLLPMVISQITDAWASIGRIEEFLQAEEQKDDIIWDMEREEAVVVEHAGFTWERTPTQEAETDPKKATLGESKGATQKPHPAKPVENGNSEESETSTLDKSEPFKLHDLNFSLNRKELVAIIGTVGSGKSSILAALAGDMRKTAGQITFGASRAFCPQYAWIQNATLKDNILFGKPYNRAWYEEVIDACALRADLDMLPAGDLTEIGERGITLSGGQKQRLNIARAIYFNADIVLMDDPLSAVDAHVGRHIFDNAISGLLKDKCRILATHQLHVLARCDRIIWVDEGKIRAFDTFQNLIKNNEGFQKMMSTTAQEEKEKQVEKTTDDQAPAEAAKEARQKKKAQKKGAALMSKEDQAQKSVSWSVYGDYLRASGSLFNGPIAFFLLVLSQVTNIATSLWLSYWVSNTFGYSTGAYIGVYAALGVASSVTMFLFAIFVAVMGTNASRVMLKRAIIRVIHSPMSFFDTTPTGRITNRFSRDVETMDNTLTDALRMFSLTIAMIVSVFTLIIVFFHYFAIALGPLLIMFVFSANYYRASAREVKRHEATLRSFVFSRFSEAISGTASIRAYGLKEHFTRDLRDTVDNMNSAYYLTFSNQRWLSIRLDVIGNILVFTCGILVITSRFNVSPSISGVVLSYILGIVQMLQFTIRQLAEVENAMNSTERIHHYGTQLEQEAPLKLTPVPDAWPQRGAINFNNVQMRYREGLPLVLQSFDMKVGGGERIGIVGRTGAGKSSIMSTLFRLVELSGGNITIDDIDIATVGLYDLRSRLAIIPQDPTLFKGTIRSNLDPFNEHTDLELWSSLRQAGLIDDNQTFGEHDSISRVQLDGTVEEEGLNYSLGQRQLIALARALVRGSQIIVCDEATSSVDFETDQKIQHTIATAFKGKTLLCIAHRLKTIIGYDRICVMDQGRIAELDTPLALWDEGGIFRGMCERSGIRREDIETERNNLRLTETNKELQG